MKQYTPLITLFAFGTLACSDGNSPSSTGPVSSAGSAGTNTAGATGSNTGGTAGNETDNVARSAGSKGGAEFSGTAGQAMGGFSNGSSGNDSGQPPTRDAGPPDATPGTELSEDAATTEGVDTTPDGTTTFFVSSTGMGDGGNLGGLSGADAFCEQLATTADASLARRTWRAYLSTDTVDAIDRVGSGPWHNANGDVIANTSGQLHDSANEQPGGPLDSTWAINDFEVPLDETGAQVAQNQHDVLTGTLSDGTAAPNLNCSNWTSNAADPAIQARVGHTNRTGLAGQRQLWHDVHDVGCSEDINGNNVRQGGGRGSFYCFAVINP